MGVAIYEIQHRFEAIRHGEGLGIGERNPLLVVREGFTWSGMKYATPRGYRFEVFVPPENSMERPPRRFFGRPSRGSQPKNFVGDLSAGIPRRSNVCYGLPRSGSIRRGQLGASIREGSQGCVGGSEEGSGGASRFVIVPTPLSALRRDSRHRCW